MRLMSNPINLKLSQKIKEIRMKRGYTQEDLAELVKTSYKYIQRIEGKNPPDLRVSSVEKIAKALGVKLGRLLDY
ncbi:MAG: helix-turn-helix transcriptional regulator [Candidatus Omnitrophica bacterium]|nr:helix-turn-helix transcriptional regulator [Candidatus Omnitrophota bacterium]